MIESRFRPSVYTVFVVTITGLLLMLVGVIYAATRTHELAMWIPVPVALFFLIWLGLLAKSRAISLTLEGNKMAIWEFFGFGRRRELDLSNLSDFTISYQAAKTRDFELMTLSWKGEKKVRISQYYFENYIELKSEILKRIKQNQRKK